MLSGVARRVAKSFCLVGHELNLRQPTMRIVLVLAVVACAGENSTADTVSETIRCAIDTSGSRVMLAGDSSITFDQPDLFFFATDSRGEVYGSPVRGGSLLHWSREGVLLPMIGSRGEGPGQFQGGPVVPFVTLGDTLYARDNNQRWAVYGPDHTFLRFLRTGPILATSSSSTQFMDNGLVLSADQSGSEAYSVLVVKRSGEVVQRLHPTTRRVGILAATRAVVAGEGGSFWVGPEFYSRGGYSLQQLDSTGKALRSLHREVRWFVADSLIRPFEQQPRSPAEDGSTRPFLFPRVQQLVMAQGGLLWIVTHVPKDARARDDFMQAKDPAALYAVGARVLEKHVEVLDVEARSIVAAMVFPSGFLLMPDGRTAIVVTEDSLTGLRQAVRLSLRVLDSAGRPCVSRRQPV